MLRSISSAHSSPSLRLRNVSGHNDSYATARDYGKGVPARHSTCCNNRGRADSAPAENQIHGASDDDPEQPAEVRPAQKPGERSLKRWNEAVLKRPAGGEAGQKRDDPAPIDVAIGAGFRGPVEFGDIDLALSLDEEVGHHDACPRTHPQQQAD